MKKILASMVVSMVALTASAQTEQMTAFKNVGIGLEAGLMGGGIQLAMPVVTNHLVFVMGYNSLKLNLDYTIENIGYGDLNNDINRLNQQVKDYNTYLAPSTGHTYSEISPLGSSISVDAAAELNMSNFKILFEYYPSANSSFHLTAGAMIGKDYLLKIEGVADDMSNAAYQSALVLNRQIKAAPDGDLVKKAAYDIVGVEDLDKVLRLNIDEKTYHLNEEARVDATLGINKVRPYFGLGFGRAIPNKRVGFQFEIGAWLHGSPKIKSSNELNYFDSSATSSSDVDDVYDIVKGISFYPQMTFRLTGRIL